MTHDTPDIGALIGSRICHDLISPLGAIGNGLELLRMTGDPAGEEMSLIGDSVAHANARIRFFRIAYGMAGAEQSVAPSELREIVEGLWGQGRIQVDWQAASTSRQEVKLALLLLQCLETALPRGGRIEVRHEGEWLLLAEGDRMRMEESHWACLQKPGQTTELGAAQVQFLLAPMEAARQQRCIRVHIGDRLEIRF
ncbi:histidine phosphotransferase [Haematobacter missouriensis]|uniref:Histidine phosphotransferase n=1 Tax=Haematobacter missouriensis TaxID=366616 RepID=A0A212AXM1_9RHOB|nr:histidine phosphotransferase family protein [Haematobacter missouriensis]KFI34233.1 histidine phosphotransferase [Haematobacter missouriensis]OWJ72365.1 histidine phosphotransferase [Haematobacter missouriensis]OWJ86214.1 histidine phosphotransferase [Haematobacter missouriensis]